MIDLDIQRLGAAAIRNPENWEWTVQGFGMIRTYLTPDKVFRLHIWAPEARVKGMTESLSDVHTHPWDFESTILFGNVTNIRYEWVPDKNGIIVRQLMVPGPAAHMLEKEEFGHLVERRIDSAGTGSSYSQAFDEIHRSLPFPGAVTIIKRDRGDREDTAYTFYRKGVDWVSAAPEPLPIVYVKEHFLRLRLI